MISTYKKSHLVRKITSYIEKNPKLVTFCFGKKRPIFLTKYLEANLERTDVTQRLRLFFRFLGEHRSIVRKQIHQHSESEFEIIFDDYRVHIREETQQKDRKLFLISTFGKTTKK